MVLSPDGEFFTCDGDPTCEEKMKNHKWGSIKSGWFQQKDGKKFCPKHFPPWVKNWRKEQAKK